MYLEEADRHLFLVVLELGFEFAEFLLKFAEFIILHVGPFCNTQNIRINDKIYLSNDQIVQKDTFWTFEVLTEKFTFLDIFCFGK